MFKKAGERWQSVATGVLPEFLILDTENMDVAANAVMACCVLDVRFSTRAGTLTFCFVG